MASSQHTRLHRGRLLPKSIRSASAVRIAAVTVAMAAGTAAVVAGGFAALLTALFRGAEVEDALAQSMIFGSVGALVAGVIVFAAFPLFTRVLSLREDAQLLQSASPLHPLLRRLMAEAPGTYMHSLAVASLAEAGAEAIGADPLLSRVGSYYHDIGKILRPCFFFENQEGENNPHDIAKPTVSASIITAHVREGLELAEEYGLPDRICAIISEHHGTSLVRYFYHRESQTNAAVFEADFRYQGVKPASKEAALVMLADGSEAAVRALGQPSKAGIDSALRMIIDERAADGQLVDSGLTDEDLEIVVVTFSRVLMSLYHCRCEYPRDPATKESCADQCCESPGA
jgi:cyclic-di-AMP phosphodiesterase PgpH